MGAILYRDTSCLYYLIDNDNSPDVYPYMLFDVIQPKVPSDWNMRVYDKESSPYISMLLGFKEFDLDLYENLFEREKEALLLYAKRKKELEERYLGGAVYI